jgi:Fe2+ transport system protein FeoA
MLTIVLAVANISYRINEIKQGFSSSVMNQRARQLLDLGFLKGEEVVLLHRIQPRSDTLVVRVGSATYALRRNRFSTASSLFIRSPDGKYWTIR